jgi:cytidylate kinase
MNNKITITGDLGSGKSAVSRVIISQLEMEYLSTGSIQRSIAERLNMTSLELNKYSETHPEIDDEIDSVFKSLNTNPKSYIVDSRMAWHFIPTSFKVYLTVDSRIAAERVFKDSTRKNEGKYADVESVEASLQARRASEVRRFMDLYEVDCSDLNNFDLVVDTTTRTPEEVAEVILTGFRQWQERATSEAL